MSEGQFSNATNEIDNFSPENVPKTKLFLIET